MLLKAPALSALCALAVVAPALGSPAGRSVALALSGSSGNVVEKVCGIRASFASYRVEGDVSFRGAVKPSPAPSSKIKVVVRRCYGQSFDVVETLSARVGAAGALRRLVLGA